MSTILITGAGGLVGATTSGYFHGQGYRIVGVDNNPRSDVHELSSSLTNFVRCHADVRDEPSLLKIFVDYGRDVKAIIHCAARKAYGGNADEYFQVNTAGTINMLDLWCRYCPSAVFVYPSTIKVYNDFPNTLNYHSFDSRFDLDSSHQYYNGFDESLPIDQGASNFYGRSKAAADLFVQEYVYQYGLHAVCLRASCLVGSQNTAVETRGMLSQIMYCTYTGTPYSIYGYGGLQVRDQLYVGDLVKAFHRVISKSKGVVYNIGGGRPNACSIREAIAHCEEITGNRLEHSSHSKRTGDHCWWITNNVKFTEDYPGWKVGVGLDEMLQGIYSSYTGH